MGLNIWHPASFWASRANILVLPCQLFTQRPSGIQVAPVVRRFLSPAIVLKGFIHHEKQMFAFALIFCKGESVCVIGSQYDMLKRTSRSSTGSEMI